MGLLKKITIVSLFIAAVAGAIIKKIIMKRRGVSALRMKRWECARRDMIKEMMSMAKRMCRIKKEPSLWKRIFQIA